jgi:hypothetical protein
MTPLEQRPALRRAVYDGLWMVGLLLTAAQAWVAGLDVPQPGWLTVALATYPTVGMYVGYQAKANTEKPQAIMRHDRFDVFDDDNGAEDYLP